MIKKLECEYVKYAPNKYGVLEVMFKGGNFVKKEKN